MSKIKKPEERKNKAIMSEDNPKAAGRPFDYQPEYCEKLIEHMKQGLSFEAFAATVGMTRQGIYNWVKEFPEFAKAKELGTAYSQLFWEEKGIKGMETRNPFNATLWIFNMKNRFKWTDRNEVTQKDPKGMSEKELIEEAEKLLAETKAKLEP